jgi:hypothetical protein
VSGMSPMVKIGPPLDKAGVRLSRSPLRRPPGEWNELQNGERFYAGGLRGITKRGGLASHNADVLAGPILAMSNVPLTSLFDTPVSGGAIAFALSTGGGTENWAFSSDNGATFTEEDRGAWSGGFPALQGQQCAVNIGTTLYFPNSGQFGSDPVTLMEMGAGAAVELIGTADWPTVGGQQPDFIQGMAVLLGTIYVLLVYPAGGGSVTYTVCTVDPDTAAVTQIGASLETSTRVLYGVVVADDHVFVMRRGAGGESGVYSSPLSVPSWSFELMPVAPTDFHPAAMVAVGDDVYLSAYPDTAPNNPIVLVRAEGAGSFSLDATIGATTDPNPPGPLVVQGSDLLCFFPDVGMSTIQAWVRSGGSWALDEDLTAAFGISGPLTMAVADGTSILIGDVFSGEILLRTAAGVWSNPANVTSLGGQAGRAG